MAPALALTYSGCANGAPIAISGKGQIDVGRKTRRLQLTLDEPPSPLHWDPTLAALGLCHTALVEPDDESPILVQSRSHLWDENGRELGAWAESAVVEQVESGFRWRVQLLRCDVRLEALERVRTVEDLHVQATPTGEGWSVVTGAWSFTTGHGNGYRGVTVTTIDRRLDDHDVLRASSFGITRGHMADGVGETVMVEAVLAKDSSRARKQ